MKKLKKISTNLLKVDSDRSGITVETGSNCATEFL